MKELWIKSFALFRRHIILWAPCSVAGILTLVLGWLEKTEIHWLIGFFATQRSVLGGEVFQGNLADARHRAMMIVVPQGLLKEYLEICLFVAALVTTKNLIQMVLDEQRPNMIAALQANLSQWREILLFSLKYMAALGAMVALGAGGGTLFASASYQPTYERLHEFAASKLFLYFLGVVAQACIAWLLVPAAIRLLRTQTGSIVLVEERKIGTAFAVAAAVVSLALEYGVGRAEIALVFAGKWEGMAIAMANTILINAPQVLLFIALSLLAFQGVEENPSRVPEVQV